MPFLVCTYPEDWRKSYPFLIIHCDLNSYLGCVQIWFRLAICSCLSMLEQPGIHIWTVLLLIEMVGRRSTPIHFNAKTVIQFNYVYSGWDVRCHMCQDASTTIRPTFSIIVVASSAVVCNINIQYTQNISLICLTLLFWKQEYLQTVRVLVLSNNVFPLLSTHAMYHYCNVAVQEQNGSGTLICIQF